MAANAPYVSRRDRITKPNTKSPKIQKNTRPTCKLRSCKAYKTLNSDGYCRTHTKIEFNINELYAQCKECAEYVNKDQRGVSCDKCHFWYHIECIKLTEKQYECLISSEEMGEELHWYCKLCKPRCLEAIAKIDLLENQTRCIAANVAKLDERVNKLESSMSTKVVQNVRSQLDERADIDNRKHNLIIFNVAESITSKEGKSVWYTQASKDSDFKMISKIASESLDMDLTHPDAKIKDILRLGPLKESKWPRPIKITFENMKTKREMLAKSKLLNRGKYKNVYINPDLTPNQRKHDQDLRNELKKRRDDGEKNLYIKQGKILVGTTQPKSCDQTDSMKDGNTKPESMDHPVEPTETDDNVSMADLESERSGSDSDSSEESIYEDVSDTTLQLSDKEDICTNVSQQTNTNRNKDCPDQVEIAELPMEPVNLNYKDNEIIEEEIEKSNTEISAESEIEQTDAENDNGVIEKQTPEIDISVISVAGDVPNSIDNAESKTVPNGSDRNTV